MNRISEINKEIDTLRKELKNVRGTQTEIYARIVGYYRSVKNWNRGKKEEYNMRKEFNLSEKKAVVGNNLPESVKGKTEKTLAFDKANLMTSKPLSYSYFYRKTCPNCPPVKNYISDLALKGRVVNVDETDGMKEASVHNVSAAPTVIFFNPDGKEIFRANSVRSIKEALTETKIPVAL